MKSKDISKTKNKSLKLSDTELNTILDRIIDGETMHRVGKRFTDQIDNAIQILDQNPKTKESMKKLKREVSRL